jgi:hypothetical protein
MHDATGRGMVSSPARALGRDDRRYHGVRRALVTESTLVVRLQIGPTRPFLTRLLADRYCML